MKSAKPSLSIITGGETMKTSQNIIATPVQPTVANMILIFLHCVENRLGLMMIVCVVADQRSSPRDPEIEMTVITL
jgi:hypothetical protein